MAGIMETLLIFIVLTDLMLLGSSRLGVYIRVVAAQGVGLGLLLLFGPDGAHLNVIVLTLVTCVMKGIVFPILIFRTIANTGIRREIEPFVGYGPSLFLGVLGWSFSLWISTKLPLPIPIASDLLVPTSRFTILVGLFLIISRKKAITQILGYLVLENGIFTFGVALESKQAFLVDIGILLDVFVAVFVMLITLSHIDHKIGDIQLDTSRLSELKD